MVSGRNDEHWRPCGVVLVFAVKRMIRVCREDRTAMICASIADARRMTIKVKMKDIQYLLLFIPYFAPGFINYQLDAVSAALYSMMNIWLYISAILVTCIYLNKSKQYYLEFVIAIALYSFLLVMSTFLNGGDVMTSMNVWGKRVTACMLGAMIIYEKRYNVVCQYFKALILINMLISLIMPAGFGSLRDGNIIFFTGHKNEFIQYMVLFLTFLFLRDGTDIRMSDRIWIFICLVNEFIGKSSTGITLFVLYIILLLSPFSKMKKIMAKHGLAIYISTTVISIIMTISSQWILNMPGITWYIQDILGKSLTFSDRTNLWAETWLRVSGNLFWGVGNVLDTSALQTLSMYAHLTSTDHNLVLTIIYRTGFIGLLGFIILCVMASYSKDQSIKRKKECMWINLGIFILLLDGFMEGSITGKYYLYWMMLIQYAANHNEFYPRALHGIDSGCQQQRMYSEVKDI